MKKFRYYVRDAGGLTMHHFTSQDCLFDYDSEALSETEAIEVLQDCRAAFGNEWRPPKAVQGTLTIKERWLYTAYHVYANEMRFATKQFSRRNYGRGGTMLRISFFDEADAMQFRLTYPD